MMVYISNNENAMNTIRWCFPDIKTEDVDDGYVHDVNQPFDSLEEAEAAIGMAHEDDDEVRLSPK